MHEARRSQVDSKGDRFFTVRSLQADGTPKYKKCKGWQAVLEHTAPIILPLGDDGNIPVCDDVGSAAAEPCDHQASDEDIGVAADA